jgi:hypothetical protein
MGVSMITNKVRDLFWSKVRKRRNGCWEWTAFKNKSGYGSFSFRGGMIRTHRASWILTNGEIPKGEGFHGTCVLHKCDNPSCVNPEHLFLGTQSENIQDRNIKGRTQRNFGRKLSEETKRKMSKPKSEKMKLKLSKSLTGKIRSEESKRKQSESRKGMITSVETRQRMSESAKARWSKS